jgi:hypothetical protein
MYVLFGGIKMKKYLSIVFFVLLASCDVGGDDHYLDRAEIIDARTMYIFITGKSISVSSSDISVIVNDKKGDYRFTEISYNIFAGDDQGSTKRYKSKLNKDLQRGDKIKLEGVFGSEVNGSCSLTYD